MKAKIGSERSCTCNTNNLSYTSGLRACTKQRPPALLSITLNFNNLGSPCCLVKVGSKGVVIVVVIVWGACPISIGFFGWGCFQYSNVRCTASMRLIYALMICVGLSWTSTGTLSGKQKHRSCRYNRTQFPHADQHNQRASSYEWGFGQGHCSLEGWVDPDPERVTMRDLPGFKEIRGVCSLWTCLCVQSMLWSSGTSQQGQFCCLSHLPRRSSLHNASLSLTKMKNSHRWMRWGVGNQRERLHVHGPWTER